MNEGIRKCQWGRRLHAPYLAPDGRQMVVIAAGGKPSMQTRLSNKIVADALPR